MKWPDSVSVTKPLVEHSGVSRINHCLIQPPTQRACQLPVFGHFQTNHTGDPCMIHEEHAKEPSCSNLSTVVASCTWAMGALPRLGSATGPWAHHWAAQQSWALLLQSALKMTPFTSTLWGYTGSFFWKHGQMSRCLLMTSQTGGIDTS